MLDVKKIRLDFPMLDNKIMQDHNLVYFDSAATSLKPKCVIEAMNDYYFNYNINVHRGDYDIAAKADQTYEKARETIASFINANKNEVIFTSGTTQSINLIALGYALNNLNEDDEIILNEAEHASNILPWYDIASKKNIKIKINDEIIETGLRKFGAILCDHVEVGCNSVLCPGTVILNNSNIYPLTRVRGLINSNVIVKDMENIIEKEDR